MQFLFFFSDVLYENVLEELAYNDDEIRKCFRSYHSDYFINKSKSKYFSKLFSFLTKNDDLLNFYINDSKISRSIELFILLTANKQDSDEINEELKSNLIRIGDYLSSNLETIMSNSVAIFLPRAFIRVIGDNDPFDAYSLKDKSITNKKTNNQQRSSKIINNIQVNQIPQEWGLDKYLKSFSKRVAKLDNILGE